MNMPLFLHYENHRVLYASLSLFLAVYNDYPTLIEALRHFESIFDNNCMSNGSFERIRVSILSPTQTTGRLETKHL